MKGDSEDLAPDSDEKLPMKAVLRLASIAFPSVVTILALLLCWRGHFNKSSILASGFVIALGIYFAIFLNRRSRGLSARIFETLAGPDRDFSHNDQAEIGALAGAAIFVGFLAYILITHW